MNGRFAGAFAYAQEAHAGQKRRGCPIIAHLMGVSSVALFFGANEDEAIAALLHDAAEDCGGRQRLVDIRKKFGDVVAEIVDGCTDTYEDPAPPWRQCKQAYLVRVPEVSASAVFVSAADKLCNIEELVRFYREDGSAVWNIYVGGREGRLWYYRALAEAFLQHSGDTPLIREYCRRVEELEQF